MCAVVRSNIIKSMIYYDFQCIAQHVGLNNIVGSLQRFNQAGNNVFIINMLAISHNALNSRTEYLRFFFQSVTRCGEIIGQCFVGRNGDKMCLL